MNLYAVGCSFTHGHGHGLGRPHDNMFQGIKLSTHNRYDCAWPWQLEPYFNHVINEAQGATGIQYANRKLCGFLSRMKESLADWVVVLQVSQYIRREYFHNRTGLFLQTNYASVGQINIGDKCDDLSGYVKFQEDCPQPPNLEKQDQLPLHHIAGHYFFSHEDTSLIYEHTKELLMIVSTLEQLGAKYLITGMTPTDYLPAMIVEYHVDHMCYSTESLLNLIPTHNFIGSASDIVGNLSMEKHYLDPCGHPNKQGHQMIADYILGEIKQRGWL